MELHKNQAGLTLGSVFAILHALWAIVVGLGFGRDLANWWHALHFISDVHSLSGLSVLNVVVGIITAFISGYALGWLFAWLWNWYGKRLK